MRMRRIRSGRGRRMFLVRRAFIMGVRGSRSREIIIIGNLMSRMNNICSNRILRNRYSTMYNIITINNKMKYK
jgi:hypothetical protein